MRNIILIPNFLTIRKYLTKYSLLFFIPALQGLAELYTAGSSSRTLPLLLGASVFWLGLSAARLKMLRLRVEDGFFTVREGLVFKRLTRVCLENIDCVFLRRTPLTALFKAAEIRIETEAGGQRRADFNCVLRERDTKALTELLFGAGVKDEPIRFGIKSVLIYAFTASAAAGILTAAPVIDKAGQILGEGIAVRLYGTVSRAALIFADILPEAGGFLAAVLLGGYIISALISLLRHARFRIYNGVIIRIKSGIISSYTIYIRRGASASVTARQGLLLRILSRQSVRISAPGYGKASFEPPLLIPSVKSGKTGAAISKILPGYSFSPLHIKSARGSLPRFILLPCIALPAAAALSAFLFRHSVFFSNIYLLGGIAAVIFLIFYISAEAECFRRGGITLGKTISGTGRRGLQVVRMELASGRLGLLTLRESPFDRRKGHINVNFREYSENAGGISVRYLDKAQVAENIRDEFGILMDYF